MKHDMDFTPDAQPTPLDYKLALLREIGRDDEGRDPSDKLPVRVFSIIDRAFAKVGAV